MLEASRPRELEYRCLGSQLRHRNRDWWDILPQVLFMSSVGSGCLRDGNASERWFSVGRRWCVGRRVVARFGVHHLANLPLGWMVDFTFHHVR